MVDLADTTVDGFLDQIAARTPAPGGGGACAVTIGMAAALVAMAARFSGNQLPNAEQVAADADRLRGEALPLVAADAAAYADLLAAFRDKTAGHEERLADASRAACEVPLQMTDVAARVAGLAEIVGTEGNGNLRGDAYTAVQLCTGAARAATTLVGINVRAGRLDSALAERAAANVAAIEQAVCTVGKQVESG